MNAFVTGSCAYGTPRPDSDLDVVILCSAETKHALECASDLPECGPVRFGKLNLIVCTDPDEFTLWKFGTRKLQEIAPVDRATAKAAFRAMEDELDIRRSGPPSG